MHEVGEDTEVAAVVASGEDGAVTSASGEQLGEDKECHEKVNVVMRDEVAHCVVCQTSFTPMIHVCIGIKSFNSIRRVLWVIA